MPNHPITPCRRRLHNWFAIGVILACAWSAVWVVGQTAKSGGAKPAPSQAASSSSPEVEALRGRLRLLEADANLEESLKAKAVELYKQAIGVWESVETLSRQAKDWETKLKEALDQTKALAAKLERLANKPPPPKDMEQLKGDQLEAELRSATLLLSETRARLGESERSLEDLPGRSKKLRLLLEDAKAQLAKLDKEAPLTAAINAPKVLTDAQQALSAAKRALLQQQPRNYEQELASQDSRLALFTAERDLATREAALLEAQVKNLQLEVQSRRQKEAAETVRQAQAARERTLDLSPVARQLADTNLRLSKDLEELTRDEAQTATELKGAQILQKEIEADFELAKKRVAVAGLTQSTGLLLRQQRMLMPDLASYRQDAETIRERIGKTAEKMLELEGLRRGVPNLEERLEDSLTSASQALDATSLKAVSKSVKDLLQDYRSALDTLQRRYPAYLRSLGDLDFTKRSLYSTARDYEQFIDQRLFWIRDLQPVGSPEDLRKAWSAARWASSVGNWRGLGSDLVSSFARSREGWLIALLIVLVLLQTHRLAWRRAKLGAPSQRGAFAVAFKNLLMAFILGAGWPLLLCLWAWCVFHAVRAGGFSLVATQGLMSAFLVLALTRFWRAVCGDKAIGQLDFGWPETGRREFRRRLLRLEPFLILAAAVCGGFEALDAPGGDSLGRLALMPAALMTSVFCFRTFRRRGGVMSAVAQSNPNSLLIKSWYGWHGLAVGAPAALAVLAALGYYYTAFHLASRVVQTAWLATTLILLKNLLLVWLRRTTQLAIARERRQLAAQTGEIDSRPAAESGTAPAETTAAGDRNRLASLSRQTRELLRMLLLGATLIGLWLVWASALPALNFIGEVEVWHYAQTSKLGEELVAVTLATLLAAFLVAAIAYACARLLPSLIELLVFERLGVHHGTRYAIATLLRYAITALGLLLVLRMLGFKWSNIQWLVAALSIGLGFGLQEVIANFVSGIILLFERPIRVGDMVTVGGVNGRVTRIQIRATTILDWDRKELIVPNKEFITGQLVNWSLSDPITRLTIPVGIAYGSNTALAEELLLKAARENKYVLAEPEPNAYFNEFGESSLNFYLRVFIDDIENRQRTIHQLHRAIDDAFRAAGVEIAFPQRDVHLDTSEPINLRIERPRSTEMADGRSANPGEISPVE